MSERKDVRAFLGRLGSSLDSANVQQNGQALRNREDSKINPYVQNKVWPGKNYVYIGHSSNLEHPLIGTNVDTARRICLSLMFEAKGNEQYCVSIEQALSFEGFDEILTRFERELLAKFPAETLLSPSFDDNGQRMHGSFTVWHALVRQSTDKRILVEA